MNRRRSTTLVCANSIT